MKGSPRAREMVFPSQSRDSLATLAEMALSVHHLHVVNDHLVPPSTMIMKISVIASFHALGLGCPQTAYLMPIYSMPAFSRQPVPSLPLPKLDRCPPPTQVCGALHTSPPLHSP